MHVVKINWINAYKELRRGLKPGQTKDHGPKADHLVKELAQLCPLIYSLWILSHYRGRAV